MAIRLRVEPEASADEMVVRFSARNPHLRVEQAANGELLVTPPAGGWSGRCGADLVYQLETWNRRTQFGAVFDASTGFRLPNGELRSPDGALVAAAPLAALTTRQQQGFLPLCPELIIEVQSATDDPAELSAKLRMYRENGAEVALRFDPAGAVELLTHAGAISLDRPASVDIALSGAKHDPLVLELSRLCLPPG